MEESIEEKAENLITNDFFEDFIDAYAQSVSLANERPKEANNLIRSAFIALGKALKDNDANELHSCKKNIMQGILICHEVSALALLENINGILTRGYDTISDYEQYKIQLRKIKTKTHHLGKNIHPQKTEATRELISEYTSIITDLSSMENQLLNYSSKLSSGKVTKLERVRIFLLKYGYLIIIAIIIKLLASILT